MNSLLVKVMQHLTVADSIPDSLPLVNSASLSSLRNFFAITVEEESRSKLLTKTSKTNQYMPFNLLCDIIYKTINTHIREMKSCLLSYKFQCGIK